MKKRSALIFGLLAALLALSMVVTGCKTDADEDTGGGDAAWPAAWGGSGSAAQTWGTGYPQVMTWNVTRGSSAGSSFLYYYNTSSTDDTAYRLKSFTGDGTTTGSFTVKKYVGGEEIGSELTVTYSLSGSVLTLVSTDIADIGGGSGKTFTKVTD